MTVDSENAPWVILHKLPRRRSTNRNCIDPQSSTCTAVVMMMMTKMKVILMTGTLLMKKKVLVMMRMLFVKIKSATHGIILGATARRLKRLCLSSAHTFYQ